MTMIHRVKAAWYEAARSNPEAVNIDEFLALEEVVGTVGAIISLTYDIENELPAELTETPEEEAERKSKLAAKERAKREAAAANQGEDDKPAEEEGDGPKIPAFEPLMFTWSKTNRAPKNLAQLYFGVKGLNFIKDTKEWTAWTNDQVKDPHEVIARALDDFCSKLQMQADEEKYLYTQVQFPQL